MVTTELGDFDLLHLLPILELFFQQIWSLRPAGLWQAYCSQTWVSCTPLRAEAHQLVALDDGGGIPGPYCLNTQKAGERGRQHDPGAHPGEEVTCSNLHC